MDRENMQKVLDVFRKYEKFLITAHVNPEGDSVGSQLAVQALLKKMGKIAHIVDDDKIPENMRFLPGASYISNEMPELFEPEVIVMLDCPVKERTGKIHRIVNDEHIIVNIDHHVSNELFGDVNWVDSEASSVGEMAFQLIREAGVAVDKDMAEAIYAAMITDTGMFNYSNTSSSTHAIAGELLEIGVNPPSMYSNIYEKKTSTEIRMLGRVLSSLEVVAEGKVAHITITKKMLADEGVRNLPTDEFINYPRSIKGVEVALFFKEMTEGHQKINVSFRSCERVNVNAIASHFGGGGHARAAGCVLICPLEDAKQKVLQEVEKAMEEEYGS